MSFVSELQRRNVVRVAIGYLAAAWFLVQIADTVVPAYGLPEAWVGILITVLGIALVPVLIATWLFELTPEGLKRDTGDTNGAPAISHRNFDRVIMMLLALAVGFFAVDKFLLDPSRDAARVEQARQEGRVEAVLESYENKSIVVLPFANLSPDPDQQYFADGLTEELLNLLAQMPELRVISRSTAFSYKGQDIAVPEVAKKLNVSHVLEGSVRKAGNQIRVTAQLIEASTDTHLWSQTYDRELADIFAIQDEISAAVIEQLELELLGAAPIAVEIDPRAYELYLQAHLMIEGDIFGSLEQARELLNEVLALEPDYLPALGELGRVNEWQPLKDGESEAERRAEIVAIVDHMAEVGPDSSYTHSWQGYIARNWHGDYQAAARHFEQAISDDPFNPEPLLRVVSLFLSDLGRYEDAEALARFDLGRDPACMNCVNALSRALRGARKYRQAAEELEKILEWQGYTGALYRNIGYAWVMAGEPERALPYLDELLANSNEGDGLYESAIHARIRALHDLGREEEFEASLARLWAEEPIDPDSKASIYAWTGQNDLAFDSLETVIETTLTRDEAVTVTQHEWFDRLRLDPRWPTFLAEHGIPESTRSNIEFDPPYPPPMQAAIDRFRRESE